MSRSPSPTARSAARRRRSGHRRAPLGAAALLVCAALWDAPPAGAGAVFEGSFERSGYAAGEVTTLSATLAWRSHRWSLSLTVPALDLDAPSLLRVGRMTVPAGDRGPGGGDGHGGGPGGGGGGPDPGGPPEVAPRNESGLGDPVLRLDLVLPSLLGAGFRAGLFGAAKAPLADDRLGTGEWDFGAGLSLWRTGLLTDFYAELGAWRVGDPAGADLADPLTWEAHLVRRLPGGRWALAGLTRGATEVVGGSGSTAEAGVWAGRSLGGGKVVGLLVTAGLDDGAPDWAVGLSWRLGVPGLRPQSGP